MGRARSCRVKCLLVTLLASFVPRGLVQAAGDNYEDATATPQPAAGNTDKLVNASDVEPRPQRSLFRHDHGYHHLDGGYDAYHVEPPFSVRHTVTEHPLNEYFRQIDHAQGVKYAPKYEEKPHYKSKYHTLPPPAKHRYQGTYQFPPEGTRAPYYVPHSHRALYPGHHQVKVPHPSPSHEPTHPAHHGPYHVETHPVKHVPDYVREYHYSHLDVHEPGSAALHSSSLSPSYRGGKALDAFPFNPNPFIETIAVAYHENEKNSFGSDRKPKLYDPAHTGAPPPPPHLGSPVHVEDHREEHVRVTHLPKYRGYEYGPIEEYLPPQHVPEYPPPPHPVPDYPPPPPYPHHVPDYVVPVYGSEFEREHVLDGVPHHRPKHVKFVSSHVTEIVPHGFPKHVPPPPHPDKLAPIPHVPESVHQGGFQHPGWYGYHENPLFADPEKPVTLAPYRVKVGTLYSLQAAGSQVSNSLDQPDGTVRSADGATTAATARKRQL